MNHAHSQHQQGKGLMGERRMERYAPLWQHQQEGHNTKSNLAGDQPDER